MSVWPSVRPDGPYVLAGGILLSSSSALPPPTFELLVNPMWGLGCGINQRGRALVPPPFSPKGNYLLPASWTVALSAPYASLCPARHQFPLRREGVANATLTPLTLFLFEFPVLGVALARMAERNANPAPL